MRTNATPILIGSLILILSGWWAYATFIPNTDKALDLVEESISSAPVLPPQEGLPFEVERKRQSLFLAAQSQNYETFLPEVGEQFRYSFGADDPKEFVTYLQTIASRDEKTIFEIIPALLKLPYTQKGDVYVWPAVFGKHATEWTQEDIEMMKTILTDEQIESYRTYGSYVYYRLGIHTDGTWMFYLAGD